jgi:hypothetical protein
MSDEKRTASAKVGLPISIGPFKMTLQVEGFELLRAIWAGKDFSPGLDERYADDVPKERQCFGELLGPQSDEADPATAMPLSASNPPRFGAQFPISAGAQTVTGRVLLFLASCPSHGAIFSAMVLRAQTVVPSEKFDLKTDARPKEYSPQFGSQTHISLGRRSVRRAVTFGFAIVVQTVTGGVCRFLASFPLRRMANTSPAPILSLGALFGAKPRPAIFIWMAAPRYRVATSRSCQLPVATVVTSKRASRLRPRNSLDALQRAETKTPDGPLMYFRGFCIPCVSGFSLYFLFLSGDATAIKVARDQFAGAIARKIRP